MEPLISIPHSVLAKLVASHSRLAQAEYQRNSSYNDEHFSHQAEDALLAFIDGSMERSEAERFWERVSFFSGNA